MVKKIIMVIVVMIAAMPSFAQSIWTEADIRKSIGKQWGMTAGIEYRTTDRLSATDRVSFGLSGDYKHQYFKIDVGYNFIIAYAQKSVTKRGNIIPAYHTYRHRAFASVSSKLNVGDFELSLRERYVFTHREGKWVPKYSADGTKPKDNEWIASKNKHILRSRLQGEYKIKKSDFHPYASVEFYDNLSDGFALEKVRYTLGSEYRINRHNRVELYYRFIQGTAVGEDNLNVIGIGYSFRL